jgi:asparaginyl-tRNA synthetase
MVEPEMAFCDLQGDMDLAEEFVKATVGHTLEHCADELALFIKFVDKALIARLTLVAERPLQRLPYADAISIRRWPYRLSHRIAAGHAK